MGCNLAPSHDLKVKILVTESTTNHTFTQLECYYRYANGFLERRNGMIRYSASIVWTKKIYLHVYDMGRIGLAILGNKRKRGAISSNSGPIRQWITTWPKTQGIILYLIMVLKRRLGFDAKVDYAVVIFTSCTDQIGWFTLVMTLALFRSPFVPSVATFFFTCMQPIPQCTGTIFERQCRTSCYFILPLSHASKSLTVNCAYKNYSFISRATQAYNGTTSFYVPGRVFLSVVPKTLHPRTVLTAIGTWQQN